MDDIINVLKAHKNYLFNKYPIQTMALFGSRSRDDANNNSDTDILVEFTKPVGIEFIRLAHDLEDITHTKVDLVTRKTVKKNYMDLIEKDLLYV